MPEEGLDGPVFRRERKAVVYQDVATVAVARVVFVGEVWVESGEAEACVHRIVTDGHHTGEEELSLVFGDVHPGGHAVGHRRGEAVVVALVHKVMQFVEAFALLWDFR